MELVIYNKTIKYVGKDGKNKTFKQVKGTMDGSKKTFNVTLTKEVNNKLIKQDIELPLAMELREEDYFITHKSFTSKDGKKLDNITIVITNYAKASEYKFTKETIDDLFTDNSKETKEVEETTDELPF